MEINLLLSYFYNLSLFQLPYMLIAWILCIILTNGSMVDFAWPSGFFIMTIQILTLTEGNSLRRFLICFPYLLCGFRFMYGWTFGRKHYKYEDRRWNLWRERWRSGQGLFSIKNVNINFLFFYESQAIFNIFMVSLPLLYMCTNKTEGVYLLEIVGFVLFVISFVCENISDFQLRSFKRNKLNNGKVMQSGFWKYSRHPNYFFEWMVWNSYVIMSIPSCSNSLELLSLISLSLGAYYFLVYFTGIPMCEKQSLVNRGEDYRKYQNSTSQFFLWFPSEQKSS